MSEDEKKLAAEREDMRAKLVARREREAHTPPDVTATLGGAITYSGCTWKSDESDPVQDIERAVRPQTSIVSPDEYERIKRVLGCGDTHTYANPDVPLPECTPESLREGIERVDAIRNAGPPRSVADFRLLLERELENYLPMGITRNVTPGSALDALLNASARVCADQAAFCERLVARERPAPFSFRLDGAIKHVEINVKVTVGDPVVLDEPRDTAGAVRSWYKS